MVMMTQDADLMELLFGEQGSFLNMEGEVLPPPIPEVAEQRLAEFEPTEDDDYLSLLPNINTLLDSDDSCPKEVAATVEIPTESPSTSFSEQQEETVFPFPPHIEQLTTISDDLLSGASGVQLLDDLTDTDSVVPSTPFSPTSPFSLAPPTPDTASSSTSCQSSSNSVKDDLNKLIKIKRKLEGKAEITVEFREPEPENLTTEEMAKRIEKREKNKLAAQKCREKKRQKAEVLEKEIQVLQSKQSAFELDIQKLVEERDHLMDIINVHSSVCPRFKAHITNI